MTRTILSDIAIAHPTVDIALATAMRGSAQKILSRLDAPLSMTDSEASANITIHSSCRLALLPKFLLKPGPVTVAWLGEVTSRYRQTVGPRVFSRTTGPLKMSRPVTAMLDTPLSEWQGHHNTIPYGDHANALRTPAQTPDIPVLM
ncbi:MAG: hypothetical protein DIU68_007535 [Chloroflexota bacterium]